jgi:hypothetical protein
MRGFENGLQPHKAQNTQKLRAPLAELTLEPAFFFASLVFFRG